MLYVHSRPFNFFIVIRMFTQIRIFTNTAELHK